MTAITKQDIINHLLESCAENASFQKNPSQNKKQVKLFVEAVFEGISETLEKGEEVKLSAFGNFYTSFKPLRPGRNPKTGDVVPVGRRWVGRWKAGQKLRKLVSACPLSR